MRAEDMRPGGGGVGVSRECGGGRTNGGDGGGGSEGEWELACGGNSVSSTNIKTNKNFDVCDMSQPPRRVEGFVSDAVCVCLLTCLRVYYVSILGCDVMILNGVATPDRSLFGFSLTSSFPFFTL
jgi:hypothetical protein